MSEAEQPKKKRGRPKKAESNPLLEKLAQLLEKNPSLVDKLLAEESGQPIPAPTNEKPKRPNLFEQDKELFNADRESPAFRKKFYKEPPVTRRGDAGLVKAKCGKCGEEFVVSPTLMSAFNTFYCNTCLSRK